MPSGRVHTALNFAVYGAIAAAASWAQQQQLIVLTPAQAISFSAAYAVGTLLLSPDLDLAEGHVDSKRHWGVLGALWVPYGLMFSHRGLSHTWLLGPLTRLAYMGLLALFVFGLLLAVWPGASWPHLTPLNISWLLPLVLGYYVSQWLHLIADGVRPDHGLVRGGKKLSKLRRNTRRLNRWR